MINPIPGKLGQQLDLLASLNHADFGVGKNVDGFNIHSAEINE